MRWKWLSKVASVLSIMIAFGQSASAAPPNEANQIMTNECARAFAEATAKSGNIIEIPGCGQIVRYTTEKRTKHGPTISDYWAEVCAYEIGRNSLGFLLYSVAVCEEWTYANGNITWYENPPSITCEAYYLWQCTNSSGSVTQLSDYPKSARANGTQTLELKVLGQVISTVTVNKSIYFYGNGRWSTT